MFPQFLDPLRSGSSNGQFYQLRSRAEAKGFLAHPVLGPRFDRIATATVAALRRKGVLELMGWDVDAKKLHQSVTVFRLAAAEAGRPELEKLLAELLELLLAKPYAAEQQLEDPSMAAAWAAMAG